MARKGSRRRHGHRTADRAVAGGRRSNTDTTTDTTARREERAADTSSRGGSEDGATRHEDPASQLRESSGADHVRGRQLLNCRSELELVLAAQHLGDLTGLVLQQVLLRVQRSRSRSTQLHTAPQAWGRYTVVRT
jgi:hypothetical protein